MRKKETIFDHNVADEEIEALFKTRKKLGLSMERDEIKKHLDSKSQDENYAIIAELYEMREDPEKMDEYIEKIRDKELQADISRTLWTSYHSRMAMKQEEKEY